MNGEREVVTEGRREENNSIVSLLTNALVVLRAQIKFVVPLISPRSFFPILFWGKLFNQNIIKRWKEVLRLKDLKMNRYQLSLKIKKLI